MGDPQLHTERHVKYWQRCLKALLPTQYTSTDSSRMSLGFFIISALDLLGVGVEALHEEDCTNIREWILRCQHPHGGFCGSPNHRYPDAFYVDVGHGKEQMDPANLPATCFALLTLGFVGDFSQVKRRQCLSWLRSLQREDGSFGELISRDGRIEGGRDMRYCFVAVAVRWMLKGGSEEQQDEDIDLQKLADYLSAAQTYDGGISESSAHEAHAGYTYCAIACLALMDRLPLTKTQSIATSLGLKDPKAAVKWLVSRQTYYTPDPDESDDDESPVVGPSSEPFESGYIGDLSLQDNPFIGFNGRSNKRVDTCYTFWVGGSLAILGKSSLIDVEPIRKFLLEKGQHQIGGFGKCPGDPPDIYHSYMSLAALATMREPSLKDFDPTLCISTEHRKKLDRLRSAF